MFDLEHLMRVKHEEDLRRAEQWRLVAEVRRAQVPRPSVGRATISRFTVALCRFATGLNRRFGIQETVKTTG